MTHKISIEAAGASKYRVTVDEGKSRTVHVVRVGAHDVERYGRGAAPQELLKVPFVSFASAVVRSR